MRTCVLFAALSLLSCQAPQPRAGQGAIARGELRLWTTRAIATVLAEVGPEFERRSGYRLRVVSDLPAGFARRATTGEPFDLLISGSATVNEWARAGRVLPATRVTLARSGIGVAVRAGTPKRDLQSVDAFRRAIIDATSIAYLQVGSGLYLDSLFEQLRLTSVVAAKATRPGGDSVAILVASGQVDLGLVVITQILTTPGVELAGPLPSAIQSFVTFVAALSASAAEPKATQELIRFLQGPVAARVIVAQGMERPPFAAPPRSSR
jgi:molybdate transport system substrate-binding protein